MEMRLEELRLKEVIGMEDGNRFGFVGDLELDTDSGQITGIVIPGRLRLLGLLGRERATVIPWRAVRRLGADTVLVDWHPTRSMPERRSGSAVRAGYGPDR